MSDAEKKDFFLRSKIQAVVEKNTQELESVTEEEQKNIPDVVQQVKKEVRRYFTAKVKGKRTRAYEDTIKVRGKDQKVLRDLKGRFAKRA